MDTNFSAVPDSFVPGPFFVILIFTALLAVAALAFFLYGRFYRRRLDRALREDAPVSAPAPEPRRAGTLILWLAAAACVTVLLVRAGALQNRLENLEYSLQREQAQLQNLENSIKIDMNKLTEKVDSNNQALIEQLRQQNSLFLRTDCELVNTDLDEKTVFVYVSAVPKTVSADTEVSLRLPEFSIPLARQEDGSYCEILGLSLDNLPGGPVELCLTENGVEQKEAFELNLWNQLNFFPVDYVSCSGDISDSDRIQLDLFVDAGLRGSASRLRSLSLQVRDGSGEVLQEKDLMSELARTDSFSDNYSIQTEFNGTFPFGKEITLLLRMEDEDGRTYERVFAYLGPSGSLFQNSVERIFDPDGTLIWEAAG